MKKTEAKTITDNQVIKELRMAMNEIDYAWAYIDKNSHLDYAIAIPYCTIKNLIDALKKRNLK